MSVRDEFRELVFARDRYRCVICGTTGQDAHHIMERRLFDTGGYDVDNGATLCGPHHITAEQTTLTCDDIRNAAGIRRIVLPEHLYPDQTYDKWSNILMPDGSRIPGELFHDESVRKILGTAGLLPLFRHHIKYPRTPHLSWSPGYTDDDRVLTTDAEEVYFAGQSVVITEKVDGEATSIYTDYIHARSVDSGPHPSRAWVKNLQGRVGWQIPLGWRLCGENLYAQHTLRYTNLSSYFMLFSVWDESNVCLGWDDTVLWAGLLDLHTVPVLWEGIWESAEQIRTIMDGHLDYTRQEGYVVRLAGAFPYAAFRRSVGKYVRKAHVGTNHHWMARAVIPNQLAANRPALPIEYPAGEEGQ